MPGKRPRQIQRTTSMSQLGAARFSQSSLGEMGVPHRGHEVPHHRGHSCPPQQEYLYSSMEPCLEAGEMADSTLAFMEEHMVVDSSAEESLFASRTHRLGPFPQAANLGSEAFSTHQWSHLPYPHNKLGDIPSFSQRRFDVGGSARASHFLDICHLCSKLLGHGRDVFIYRGDKAFCSVECRHLQIMADERREKDMLTGAKDGSVTTQASDSPNANQVETVAAA